MRVEGGVGEALPLVLHEEFAVPHADVIDLIARAAPVHPLPLLRGLLALPATTAAEEGWTPWTWDGAPWGWHRSQNSSQIPIISGAATEPGSGATSPQVVGARRGRARFHFGF